MYTYYIYMCILLYYHCYVIYCSIISYHIMLYHVSCINMGEQLPCLVLWTAVIHPGAPWSPPPLRNQEIMVNMKWFYGYINMDKYHVTYEHSWDIRTFVKPLDASGKYGHLVNNWLWSTDDRRIWRKSMLWKSHSDMVGGRLCGVVWAQVGFVLHQVSSS